MTKTGESAEPLIDRFCTARGIARTPPLPDTLLAGDRDAIAGQMSRYAAAGATDLTLGFADFPSTGMLEAFAASVLHRVVRA